MASDKIKQSSDSNFQSDVLAASSSTPVVVDFWATWCGPCRAMAPHLETLATELDGRVQIVKVDVDHNPNVAATHGIRGLPTLLVFKDGAVVDQLVGNPGSLGKLRDFIGKHA